MKTDDLIEALAMGIEPVRPARPSPLLLLAAVAASMTAVVVILGVRPDIGQAIGGPVLWLKALYTLALAGSALWLLARLGRPGAPVGAAGWTLGGVVGAAVLLGAIELMRLPPELRMDDWLGFTWRICALNILKVSVFAAPMTWLAARRLAPTRPMLSGAALGVATGAIGATAYGLHCPEATAAFVATFYTLGVFTAGAIGAAVGRFALRW